MTPIRYGHIMTKPKTKDSKLTTGKTNNWTEIFVFVNWNLMIEFNQSSLNRYALGWIRIVNVIIRKHRSFLFIVTILLLLLDQ